MITRAQAKMVLQYAEPLRLNHPGFPQPITPNHICLTDDDVRRLGINETAFDDHISTFYDGKDYDSKHVHVHVFLKDKLTRFASPTWEEREQERRSEALQKEVG